MDSQLLSEIQSLKQLSKDELYRLFHKMQFEILSPQWEEYFRKLVPHSADGGVQELFGPRSPEVPEWYQEEILKQITRSRGKEVLLLHHVLCFSRDPLEIFEAARSAGFKLVVVHESPRDGSFKYEAYPSTLFFNDRHQLAFERHGQAVGNPPLRRTIDYCTTKKWKLISDTDLDISYQTVSLKRGLIKLELALDLIDNSYSNYPSRFNEIWTELERWYAVKDSYVTVRGCSRWLVFDQNI